MYPESFFFNDTATTEIYTLSLHDALPILGFARVQENAVYAQHSRGKFEGALLHYLSQVMWDLNRLASDLILYSMPEFGYIELPDNFCTGSSIMPQKKNPDVLELMRAKFHVVDRKSTRLNSSHKPISYAVFCLKKKNQYMTSTRA